MMTIDNIFLDIPDCCGAVVVAFGDLETE